MGTMIRLKNVLIQNDSLPIAQIPYGGITDGVILASHIRRSVELSADISGNNTSVAVHGTPTFKSTHLSCVGISGLETGVDTTGNTSRTMCVVARLIPGFSSNLFLINNYDSGRGCSIFASPTSGLRCQVVVNNNNTPTNIFPGTLAGLAVNLYNWFFAALTVDVTGNKATFYVPGVNYQFSVALGYPLYESSWRNLMIGYAGTIAQTGESNIAYATYHNRALTVGEIMIQHASARSYCSAVGLTVV